jgi:hypothetical protein
VAPSLCWHQQPTLHASSCQSELTRQLASATLHASSCQSELTRQPQPACAVSHNFLLTQPCSLTQVAQLRGMMLLGLRASKAGMLLQGWRLD